VREAPHTARRFALCDRAVTLEMGVRVLARSTSTTLKALEARVEALGATVRDVRWRCNCTYMIPRSRDMGFAELFVLSSSEDLGGEQYLVSRDRMPPSSDLATAAGATAAAAAGSGAVRVLRAGAGMSAVLEAMQTHSQRLKVAVEGRAHACGDFVVRMGELFLNSTLAGIAVELEYLPCSLASAAATVAPLQALLDKLLPSGERDFCSSSTECFHEACGLPAAFGLEHGALLYVGLMRQVAVVGDQPAGGAAAGDASSRPVSRPPSRGGSVAGGASAPVGMKRPRS
jgi:hypothetical protein